MNLLLLCKLDSTIFNLFYDYQTTFVLTVGFLILYKNKQYDSFAIIGSKNNIFGYKIIIIFLTNFLICRLWVSQIYYYVHCNDKYSYSQNKDHSFIRFHCYFVLFLCMGPKQRNYPRLGVYIFSRRNITNAVEIMLPFT